MARIVYQSANGAPFQSGPFSPAAGQHIRRSHAERTYRQILRPDGSIAATEDGSSWCSTPTGWLGLCYRADGADGRRPWVSGRMEHARLVEIDDDAHILMALQEAFLVDANPSDGLVRPTREPTVHRLLPLAQLHAFNHPWLRQSQNRLVQRPIFHATPPGRFSSPKSYPTHTIP